MLDIFTVELVSVLKMSALETPTRELSEDVLFGIGTIGTIGTLLVVEQSSLESRLRGHDIYTVLYLSLIHI